MPSKFQWTYSRYLRLFWDCGLDPYYRLQSLQKRLREEKKARRYLKIGWPRIWTVRQAASAINTWGISYGHFPRREEYRDDEDRPKYGIPAASSKKRYFEALQKVRLDDVADECDLHGAPIQITDSGVQLLSNRQ
jgi:hypothetical protein